MKKFLLLIAAVFSLTLGLGVHASAATPDDFWKVDIFTPSVTETTRTLNVAYNVVSIYDEDNKFDVTLYQNEVAVANQEINHAAGNSGTFSVTLPVTGTYTFQVSAKITAESTHNGQVKASEPKAVKIVDGPTPTVTTVAVNTAGANQAGGGAGAAAVNNAAAGQAAGANTTNNGQVTPNAANTSNNSGTSLGASTTKAKASSNGKWYALGAAVIVLAGGAYYWFMMRPKLND